MGELAEACHVVDHDLAAPGLHARVPQPRQRAGEGLGLHAEPGRYQNLVEWQLDLGTRLAGRAQAHEEIR